MQDGKDFWQVVDMANWWLFSICCCDIAYALLSTSRKRENLACGSCSVGSGNVICHEWLNKYHFTSFSIHEEWWKRNERDIRCWLMFLLFLLGLLLPPRLLDEQHLCINPTHSRCATSDIRTSRFLPVPITSSSRWLSHWHESVVFCGTVKSRSWF